MDTTAPSPTADHETPEASGTDLSDSDAAWHQHFARGYRRAEVLGRIAIGVLIASAVLLVGAAAGFISSAQTMGFFDPAASGLTRAMGEAYAAMATTLTVLGPGSLLLFGLALRAASGARRAAVDASVLASGLSTEEKAALVLGR